MVEDCDVHSFWYRWSVIEDWDIIAMQDFYYSFRSDLDYLWDWVSVNPGIFSGRYRGAPSVQFRVQCDYFSLRSQIRPPWARETAAALGLECGPQDSKAHSPGDFDISYDPEHREAVGVLLGMKETLLFQLAGLLCAISSFICSFIISVGAAGMPDFPDDLTGIASFGKVLLRVWTIKKVDKSGHGV
ncbi:hypothetical protein K439DRAFT_1617895 [Ramaria rubella]|nr:hypothetical protein K439DRAFT_1617895 [Ramaria rubella]